MASQRQKLPDPLAHTPLPSQLGLFDQRGLTVGQVNASQKAVAAELDRRARGVPGTRFPVKAGCALCCTCDRCINPELTADAGRA
jgi:hypothetical protein